MRIFDNIKQLAAAGGQLLGTSDWKIIDQARIEHFADTTDDHQWIHIDRERSARESPFGATVAHGFLTLSLLPALTHGIFDVASVATHINYGLDSLRFPAPVVAGKRVRAHVVLTGVEARDADSHLVRSRVTVEIEHGDKPALVADTLSLYLTAR